MLLSVIFYTFLNEHEQNGFVFSMAHKMKQIRLTMTDQILFFPDYQ